jgi:pyruvate/2-oxoglutarate dehydrogenase complex dihydrolipoamide dehydrogenase (E3) component
LGGDCTWYGCVPSKVLLKSSQVFSLVKRLEEFGISTSGNIRYDASRVMSHVRDVVKRISTHHPPEVFEKRGIRVLFGNAKFVDNRTVELNGMNISSKRFIICTGSHPLVPPIQGLKDIDYLTNENVFDLEVLPESLVVLGGGPIGVEISQAFSMLGVEVSIIEMLDRLLFREDEEIAQVLTDMLVKQGVKIYVGKKAVRFSREGNLAAVTVEDKNNNQSIIKAEKILVAVGRAANVDSLNLEKAGVRYTKKAIEVDNTLKTSAPNIYACGDVVGPYQFSHMAEYQAVIAVGNALFPFKRKVNYSATAWCTFTAPELAHLGLTEEEAGVKYKDIKIYRSEYSENDRAVTDLEETGFAKVICNKSGCILGAHIVGANAGEIIHEYVLAKSARLNITKLSSAIHIYPTLAQIVKRTGDQYYTEIIFSGWFKRLSKFFIKMMR